MRRDKFTAAIRHGDDQPPTLDIVYEGPAGELADQLTDGGKPLDAADLDAAFRLLAPLEDAADDTGSTDSPDAEEGEGVFSLTHRLTGSYLFEVNLGVEDVTELVAAAREADDAARYQIRIRPEDGDTTVYEMSALFVYDSEGELLRQRSLIPSGVEL